MEFVEKDEFEVFKFNLQKQIKSLAYKPHVRKRTLSGDLTLRTCDCRVQFIDCGGTSRVIILPSETASLNFYFYIFNISDAAEDLTIKDPSLNVICTVSQDEGATIWCWRDPSNGGMWRGFVGGTT